MNSIEEQLLTLLITFLFGMQILFSYSVFNRAFYKRKRKPSRLIAEILFFAFQSLIYFFLLLLCNDVKLNIYLLLAMAAGIIAGYKVFSSLLLSFLERAIAYLKKKIINPIKLYFHRIFVIIKKRIKRFLKKTKLFNRSKKKSGKRRIRRESDQNVAHWLLPPAFSSGSDDSHRKQSSN